MFNFFKATPSQNEPADEPAYGALPAGLIENNGQCVSASSDLVALACDGWVIKQKMEALQKELKAITDKLENSLGVGAALAVDGVCRVTLGNRQTFKLTDVDKCAALLGGRFADLVDSSIEYTLSDKLKAIVLDPDHPLSKELRGCVLIKNIAAVTFRPGKAL